MVLLILAWGAYRLRVWQVTTQLRERFEERLKERTRIAQELHDSLIQDVMGISLQIDYPSKKRRVRLALLRFLMVCSGPASVPEHIFASCHAIHLE